MAQERMKPTGGQEPSSSADEATNSSHDMADNPEVVGGGLQPDDPELLEAIEFSKRRPILLAIAGRLSEVTGQSRKLPDGSPERKKLQKRFRRLEAYINTPPYALPKSSRDAMILSFCGSLIMGQFGSRGRRLQTWEDVKYATDQFAKAISKRPAGNPVRYRRRITEALEIKLAHPERTWHDIFDEMEDDLRISFDDFKRQIDLLKRLLREEGIALPQPAEDEQA